MRIKILRNIGRRDTMPKTSDNPESKELPAKKDGSRYREGEVAEFDKEVAEKFIQSGLGVVTDDPVGPPPPAASPHIQAPIPVTVVEAPKPQPAEAPKHRTEPPEHPPGNKDTRPETTKGK